MASSSKDIEKGIKGGSNEPSSSKAPTAKQTSALGAMAQGLAGLAVATAKTVNKIISLALSNVMKIYKEFYV